MTPRRLLKALPEAFYNPAVYREAIQHWQGFGGRYLALLALVLGLTLAANIVHLMNVFSAEELPYIINQIPTITVANGRISVDGPQPVHVANRMKNFDVTIDTNATETDLRNTKTMVGIGATYLFVQANNNYQVIYTKEFGESEYKLSRDRLRGLWDANAPVIKIVSVPLLWISQLFNLIIQCSAVALLSYVITAFLPEEYDFLTRMRLSALALTPATVITTLMNVTMDHVTAPWFNLLLACLYFYVMIILIRRLPADQTTKA